MRQGKCTKDESVTNYAGNWRCKNEMEVLGVMKRIGILDYGQKDSIMGSLAMIADRDKAEISLVGVSDVNKAKTIDALVIPRASSIDYSTLLWQDGWDSLMNSFEKDGRPVLSICGSMIVFMKRLGDGCTGRRTFGYLDAKVDNDIFNGRIDVTLRDGDMVSGDFTDAPAIRDIGPSAEAIAWVGGEVVGIRQGRIYGFSYFDPKGRSYMGFLKDVIG